MRLWQDSSVWSMPSSFTAVPTDPFPPSHPLLEDPCVDAPPPTAQMPTLWRTQVSGV